MTHDITENENTFGFHKPINICSFINKEGNTLSQTY